MSQLIQGTPEWLEMRRGYLMASDAPVIMGVSPWKSLYQLWEEKHGIKDHSASNSATRYGKEMEETARSAYESYTGLSVSPMVIFHKTVPYMGASLDGLTEHGDMAVEIKNCCLQDHELAKRGEIPVKYIPQVQHQLACLGADMMHYFSFHKGEGVIVEVPLDSSYVNQLYKAEDQFWKDCIQGFKEPALTEKDYVLKQDEEWKALASQWMELNDQIKTLEQKEEKIRQSLIERAEGMNCRGHGIKLSQSTSKGSIDYSSIPGLCSMDLERYRKSKVVKWRLTKENKGR